MVKPRKGGLKAPPRVHAGEAAPEVVATEAVATVEAAVDAAVVTVEAAVDAAVVTVEAAVDVAVVTVEAAVDVAVAGAEPELSGSESAALVVEAVEVGTAEESTDSAAVGVVAAESDEAGPEDSVVDPLAAALVAAEAPRVAGPGVVLSDELPIDPDDDLREVEGEASARLVSILESLLFSAAKPLSVKDLRKVLQETSQRQIQLALRHLLEVTRSRGVVLAQVAGGFQFRTHPENALWVQKMLQAKPAKLSRTQIETLAIVAYRQPVTRPEIDNIRGVDSGAVLKSLLERELIQIVGKKDEPGRPLLYGTTVRFLEFFNLRSLRDLPTLRDFRDLSDESKATLRDKLGDLQVAEVLGQEVFGFDGSKGHVEEAAPGSAEGASGAGDEGQAREEIAERAVEVDATDAEGRAQEDTEELAGEPEAAIGAEGPEAGGDEALVAGEDAAGEGAEPVARALDVAEAEALSLEETERLAGEPAALTNAEAKGDEGLEEVAREPAEGDEEEVAREVKGDEGLGEVAREPAEGDEEEVAREVKGDEGLEEVAREPAEGDEEEVAREVKGDEGLGEVAREPAEGDEEEVARGVKGDEGLEEVAREPAEGDEEEVAREAEGDEGLEEVAREPEAATDAEGPGGAEGDAEGLGDVGAVAPIDRDATVDAEPGHTDLRIPIESGLAREALDEDADAGQFAAGDEPITNFLPDTHAAGRAADGGPDDSGAGGDEHEN